MKKVYYTELQKEGRKELKIFRDLIAESSSKTSELDSEVTIDIAGSATLEQIIEAPPDITNLVVKSLSRLKITHLITFGSLKLDFASEQPFKLNGV